MSSQDSEIRTLRAKKSSATETPQLAKPGHSVPRTFFLRSEQEMDKRGRKASRESDAAQEEATSKTPNASMMSDNPFGVQSLEDTMNYNLQSSESSLSRTDSNISELSTEAGAEAGSVTASRKRKAGNRIHPKILATGQRILSAEHPSASPVSNRSNESPLRAYNGRRASFSSSINVSQPMTPLKMSPHPESAMPSTPRSGSPKSFRLSDEEASIASDNNSQAIQSSSGDEDEEASTTNNPDAMPQLVMPSIAMPTRRPFTERGQRMGRLKIMVVGAKGVGKTSLIQSVCRASEDVVHMHSITGNNPIHEIGASTRPYPTWWTDFESRRSLLRRKSIGDGVLERNITFIDTPGLDCERNVQQVLEHFKTSLSRVSNLARLHDSEIINTLSGEGGLQIDAVLYVFDSAVDTTESSGSTPMDHEQSLLLQYLCKWTNVIPVIGRADAVGAEQLVERKMQLLKMLKEVQAELCIMRDLRNEAATGDKHEAHDTPFEPYAISSVIGDDPEMLDASILMSSSYLQPLLPSELSLLVNQLFEPDNMARLRHLSATKYLLWRQAHLATVLGLEKELAPPSPLFEPRSAGVTNSGSILEEPSKVLVPHGSSSYFRSISPSATEDSANGNAEHALTRFTDNASPIEPFRQIRLARWAQDLQRSLDNERRKYKQMYDGWTSNTAESESEPEQPSDPNTSLTTTNPKSPHRPTRGRLGGDLAIIDPRDPLGVLAFGQAFRRQGWFALQLAGIGGLVGAAIWWISRNWLEVQDFLGLGEQTPITIFATPPPSRSWLDEAKRLLDFEAWFP